MLLFSGRWVSDSSVRDTSALALTHIRFGRSFSYCPRHLITKLKSMAKWGGQLTSTDSESYAKIVMGAFHKGADLFSRKGSFEGRREPKAQGGKSSWRGQTYEGWYGGDSYRENDWHGESWVGALVQWRGHCLLVGF